MGKPNEPKQELERSMNLGQSIIFVVGLIIGSGIFLKPATLLSSTGSTGGALLTWLAGGAITIASALTVAEIAAYIPKIGGLYTYLTELAGKRIAFLFNWAYIIISEPGSVAALCIAASSFASYFIPMTDVQQKLLAIGLVVVIVVTQILSTKGSVWLEVIATIGKLAPMAIIVVFGCFNGNIGHINMTPVDSAPAGIGVALLSVLWGYEGWVSCCAMADDMKNPARDLPKAIVLGVAVVILVYVSFSFAIYAVLPADQIIGSSHIAVDAAVALFGDGGAALITAGMMISVFGSANAVLACGARNTKAMGEKKQMLGADTLASLHPKFGTPAPAIIFQGVLTILFILSGTYDTITNMLTFTMWIFYTAGTVCIFKLRKTYKHNPELYSVPFYPIVPLIGIGGGVFVFFSVLFGDPVNALLGVGITIVALPIYLWCDKHYGTPEDQTASLEA